MIVNLPSFDSLQPVIIIWYSGTTPENFWYFVQFASSLAYKPNEKVYHTVNTNINNALAVQS